MNELYCFQKNNYNLDNMLYGFIVDVVSCGMDCSCSLGGRTFN